jgi:glutamyl-tRNA synthetase
MTDQPSVRTRFAPSPSGHLHVGGARTALFNWAFARAHGGTFLLRIEDTDQKRSSDAASMAFLEDLRWLGMEWDEGPEYDGSGGGDTGPYYQSQRLDIYNVYFEKLIDAGKAYYAFDTPEELDAERDAARAARKNYRYGRSGLALDADTVKRYLAEGREHVIRLRIPDDAEVRIDDRVCGDVRVSTNELDDFIIRKRDGYPTYHFAVVVDDALMNVTHVIRGQEHLANTPRHVLIQDAFDFPRPVYAHLPLIFNTDGSKMSKRDKDKTLREFVGTNGIERSENIAPERWTWWLSKKEHQLDLDEAMALAKEFDVALPEINVDDFRRAGYLPEVMVNYLSLLGWSPGGDVEKFDGAFLCKRFDLDRVLKSASKFDRDKLLAFSLDALQSMDADAFVTAFREHVKTFHPAFLEKLDDDAFELLARANHERSKTLDTTVLSGRFFICNDDAVVYETSKAVRKALTNGEPSGYDHLEAIAPVLARLETWTAPALEETIKAYAETHAEGKLGQVAQPLRIAVSGGTISPAIFDTLAILGRDSVLRRIQHCLAQRESLWVA